MTFVLIFGLLAVSYLRYTKPVYESSMVMQLSDQDDAKEVLNIENMNSRNHQISGVVELLRSELLFERAIESLNLNISLYSRGEILTEEKYLSSSFHVQPYALNDSSMISNRTEIAVNYVNGKVILSYDNGGMKKSVSGQLGEHLKNDDMDVVIKSSNKSEFIEGAQNNELYFMFNSVESIAERLKGGLTVTPIDVSAKTIEISFRGHNAQLCHDVTWALSEAFISFDEEVTVVAGIKFALVDIS